MKIYLDEELQSFTFIEFFTIHTYSWETLAVSFSNSAPNEVATLRIVKYIAHKVKRSDAQDAGVVFS